MHGGPLVGALRRGGAASSGPVRPGPGDRPCARARRLPRERWDRRRTRRRSRRLASRSRSPAPRRRLPAPAAGAGDGPAHSPGPARWRGPASDRSATAQPRFALRGRCRDGRDSEAQREPPHDPMTSPKPHPCVLSVAPVPTGRRAPAGSSRAQRRVWRRVRSRRTRRISSSIRRIAVTKTSAATAARIFAWSSMSRVLRAVSVERAWIR
jgi:hypothetical protein